MKSIGDILHSYEEVDEQGRHVNGTDKHGPNHRYGDAYERIIARGYSRNLVRLMMEVGVADGSCLRAWREAFPNAQIVGMDIHHSDRAHGERIEFHRGDQTKKEDCERAAAGRLFDLIIEDATHSLPNTLLTLLYLWPFVRPGGLYVVEEWDGVHGLRANIAALWPCAEIVDTIGPSGGVEPLVVLRKPL